MIKQLTKLIFLSDIPHEWVLDELHNLVLNMSSFKVLACILNHRAATAYFLRSELKMTKPTVYKSLNYLKDQGYIVESRPVSIKGTRSVKVYAVPDYTADDVLHAREKDRITRTPAYTEVERIYQAMLDDYLLLKITNYLPERKKIYTGSLNEVGRKLVKGVRWLDIQPMVLQKFEDQGYKVVVG